MQPEKRYPPEWDATQKLGRIAAEPKRERRDPHWVAVLSILASLAGIIGLFVSLGIIHPFGDGTASSHATTTTDSQSSYAAASPGFGCDHGGGNWSKDQIPNTTWTCSDKGLVLTQHPSPAATEAEVTFHWPGHTFAPNYTLHVTMSSIAPAIACGGIGFRGQGLKDYEFDMCADGTWQLNKTDEVGSVSVSNQGKLSDITQPYNVKLTIIYSTVSATVNGQSIPDMSIDPTYTVTNGLNLDCAPYTATFTQPNTATLSDFVYSPLP